MRGTEGRTLTTYYEYGQGWEPYKKWWCRGKSWISCRILTKTTGTDKLVKNGRASTQDNPSRCTFTMTLEERHRDDADTYWCGTERTDVDPVNKLSEIVDPGRHYSLLCSGTLVPPAEESNCSSLFPSGQRGVCKQA